MLRLAGWGVYEDARFHDLCDEVGILVWQDLMFANLDYPVGDPGFRADVEAELDAVLRELAGRPSFAVLCGNSEVEQQVAMLGLDPALGRGELFGEVLPAAVAAGGGDAPYLPSAPCGDGLPFRPDRGVANYFGVGGYRRPLEDVRRAGVRFASECLAIANVPEDDPPSRTAGVPRDVGADWDFADVRDHYLALLFGDVEPERYYELSRAVSGEVMAEVFGEWRRAGSPCGGGLVLWLRDLLPGSGWGLLDAEGRPKPVWHRLRRALAPVAVWTTDEGLGGVVAHVANDGAEGLEATLRVTAYRDGAVPVGEGTEPLALPAHGAHSRDLEELLGHFADLSWAYRFGPPQQDAVAVAVERDGELLAHAMRFPVGFPRAATAEELGLEARVRADPPRLELRSTRVVAGVRIVGGDPREGVVDLEPGRERVVALGEAGAPTALHAVNLLGSVEL
jgi:beta-mannosidase